MPNDHTAIIILAAGQGTRMKSSLPKVLHSIGNKPMVSHVIDVATTLSSLPPIVVIGRNSNVLEQTLKSQNVTIAYQEQQLGTADAVKAALSHLPESVERVAILYADTPLVESATIQSMLETLNTKNVATVLGFTPADAAEYGRLVMAEDGSLGGIVEYKEATPQERAIDFCNSGVMAISGKHIRSLLEKVDNNNAKGEYYLTDVIALARNEGFTCCAVCADENEVLGVNNRQQLSEAEFLYQSKKRQQHMLNGVTLVDPETVYFSHDTQIEADVVIEPSVFFGENVTIGSGATIKAFSHIDGANIGKNAIIGPFARLRPGTELAENVKVGNFVEIKKSSIGKGSKVPHLSYIGDATLEEDVNVGAGTITCNYDGVNKHQTYIKAGAFIGSNTALVAPVSIGKEALVGAGSTVTEDVGDHHLGLSRAKQVNMPKK